MQNHRSNFVFNDCQMILQLLFSDQAIELIHAPTTTPWRAASCTGCFLCFYAVTGHIYRDTEIQTVIHTDHIILFSAVAMKVHERRRLQQHQFVRQQPKERRVGRAALPVGLEGAFVGRAHSILRLPADRCEGRGGGVGVGRRMGWGGVGCDLGGRFGACGFRVDWQGEWAGLGRLWARAEVGLGKVRVVLGG